MAAIAEELRKAGMGAHSGADRVTGSGNVLRYQVVNQGFWGLGASAMFVSKAVSSACEVRVSKGGAVVNGKSILELLGLKARPGDTLTIEAEGPEAGDVVSGLSELVGSGFGIAEYNRV